MFIIHSFKFKSENRSYMKSKNIIDVRWVVMIKSYDVTVLLTPAGRAPLVGSSSGFPQAARKGFKPPQPAKNKKRAV